MSEVIVTFKVMPTSVDVDFDDLESRIKETVNPERMEREPIAFGLVALNVTKLVPDEEGQLEYVENRLRELADVGNVEVTEISRSL